MSRHSAQFEDDAVRVVGGISDALAARIEELAPALLPNGTERDGLWTGTHTDGTEFHIWLTGRAAGTWWSSRWSEDEPDTLQLVIRLAAGGHASNGLDWARRWLKAGTDDAPGHRPAAVSAPVKRPQSKAQADRERAAVLWAETMPLEGTPAEAWLDGAGVLPAKPAAALGAAGATLCVDKGRDLPSLVARLTDRRGPCGAHQVFLDQDPDGGWSAVASRTLGRRRGAVIDLSDLSDVGPAGGDFVLSLGLFDALAFALAEPKFRSLAVLGLSELGDVKPLPGMARLCVAPSSAGRDALRTSAAFGRLLVAMRRAKVEVLLCSLPEGCSSVHGAYLSSLREAKR